LAVLLWDIEQTTDWPETFYACQKRFLCGKAIDLRTIRGILYVTIVLEEINVVILILLIIPLTISEQTRHGYTAYIVFGSWMLLFGLFISFLFYSFLLPVLYSINDFHIIPCLWKNYNEPTVVSLELCYNLLQESSCDLYFIIDGKRFVLNTRLRNELKRKKILKVMAINDKYYGAVIFASLVLLPYAFSQFVWVNPFLVGLFFRSKGLTAAVVLTVTLAVANWFYGHIFHFLYVESDYRWTERLETKIRSLEMDEETPMVRV
jgi:magnesium-transporting ATPase (P-type)